MKHSNTRHSMRRYRRSMRRRRSMWRRLCFARRRRRSCGGHSMRRYRRSMRRRLRSSAARSAIARSYRRYRCGVFGDIRDCRVGVTPQMCNRVTNHGDMGTFSRPGPRAPMPPRRPPISSHRMASVRVFRDVSQCFKGSVPAVNKFVYYTFLCNYA